MHALADPISWLPDDSVYLVLLALAIDYIDDRDKLVREPTGFIAFRLLPRPAQVSCQSRLVSFLARR